MKKKKIKILRDNSGIYKSQSSQGKSEIIKPKRLLEVKSYLGLYYDYSSTDSDFVNPF